MLASELANAKDIQGVVTLQSLYAQTQLQSYARQTQELGRLMAEAVRSMKPKSWGRSPNSHPKQRGYHSPGKPTLGWNPRLGSGRRIATMDLGRWRSLIRLTHGR